MAKSTISRTAWPVLVTACNLCLVAAQSVTTKPNTAPNLPRVLLDSQMKLSLRPSESGPVTEEYSVVPLTVAARLNQSTDNGSGSDTPPPRNVQGKMVVVDQSNYNSVNDQETIAYVSCDSNSGTDSYINPDDILDVLVGTDLKAILLYSTVGNYCDIEGQDLDSRNIWTMANRDEAQRARNTTEDSTGAIIATIERNGDSSAFDDYPPSRPEGGSNSAVAMSILYSITGIITLLFLVIIGSGALRAHRHPERYGPREGYGGRPRQSRAKGLARAVLDTIPIVKFGDSSRNVKPDPEHELESASGERNGAAESAPDEARADETQRDVTTSDANPTGAPEPEATAPAAAQETRQSTDAGNDEHMGCSICTEDFTMGEDVRVLPCDHKFHPQCVDPWLVNVSGTCPLCRLDLRPQPSPDGEDGAGEASTAPPSRDGEDAAPVPAPAPALAEGEAEMSGASLGVNTNQNQRHRRSRLLPDWNRLRHASVDERIQALRRYRQSEQQQQAADATSGRSESPASGTTAHDRTGHNTKLTARLREKFRIRTRPHTRAQAAQAQTETQTQTQTQTPHDEGDPTAPPRAAIPPA